METCDRSTSLIYFQKNWTMRKQPPQVFYKKGVLKNSAKFTEKHLLQSAFFIKVASLRPATATLLKKTLQHKCFLVTFAKFLRTPNLKNICERLLLTMVCFPVFLAVFIEGYYPYLFIQTEYLHWSAMYVSSLVM